MSLSQRRLKEVLRYIPETGIFIWTARTKGRRVCGAVAGVKTQRGYISIQVDGTGYQAHRLAYLYRLNVWPDEIDHIYHDKSDNRWSRIRDVSHSENMKNRTLNANNSSGIMGIALTRNGRWEPSIGCNGVNKYLGNTRDFFEACCRRKSAENLLKFHKNHGEEK